MFYTRCKDKIEKMLSDGEVVSDADKPDWMKGEQLEGSILYLLIHSNYSF